MGLEVGIWRLDGGLTRLPSSALADENRLEQAIESDANILGTDLLILGRQVVTAFGTRIDLLGIDSEGNLVVIELKHDRTPREIVAQVLDYGSWVVNLGYEDIEGIYANPEGTLLEEAFEERFGSQLPESLNQQHSLVIVASELDASTERIVQYLSTQFGVPINVVFFRYFADEGREYLSRAWLLTPSQVDGKPQGGRRKEQPWNGQDYYVSFGDGTHRSWEDARKYGFVSGGGKPWYSRSLKALQSGNRVFVLIPGKGYVGVGTVAQLAVPARNFVPSGGDKTILNLDLQASQMDHDAGDDDLAEWVVGIDWIKTLPEANAIWEPGLFANTNTACKMRSDSTIRRLVALFGLSE